MAHGQVLTSRLLSYIQSAPKPRIWKVSFPAAETTGDAMTPSSQQQQTASDLAALVSKAERPCMFSRREGSLLRLVPRNESLSAAQLEQQLKQLLGQSHMQQLLSEVLPVTHPSKRKQLGAS
jgi:hypothetical protein